jgi:glycolate oxidase FAD binding subunit
MIEQKQRILEPASQEEAAKILYECSQAGRSVRIVGGGTKQDLGNPYAETALRLSTRKLDKLIDYQPQDLTVTVGAGMPLARLQELLAKQGQMLPLDPATISGQTVGGVLATNRSGPRRLLYGTARDLLLGCRFVLADGNIGRSGGRVVKNVSGYDLHKLFIGSFGTLGLLTEVTFKVVPIPQTIGVAKAFFEDPEAALRATRQCATSNLMPSLLEIMDDTLVGATSNKTDGQRGLTVIFGAEGFESAVKSQLVGMREICAKANPLVLVDPDYGNKTPLALANLVYRVKVPPVLVLRASSVLTNLPRTRTCLADITNELGLEGILHVRAGTGIIYLFTWPTKSQYPATAKLIEQARAAIHKMGGSLVVERAPLEIKQVVDVWGDMGDAIPAMQALKKQFDPQGLLNPGVMDLGVE